MFWFCSVTIPQLMTNMFRLFVVYLYVLIPCVNFRHQAYCPFDISQKEVFLLGVLFKMKIFCPDWPHLIRNHLFFSVSVFCSQILTLKLKVQPKTDLTFAIAIVKRFFLYFFCLRKYFFYFSLLSLNYWCFTTILRKFSEKTEHGNLLKICLQVTYPTDFSII